MIILIVIIIITIIINCAALKKCLLCFSTEGPVRCDQCDTFFNSRRILDMHQAYYCQGKMVAQAASSDTDTEDTTSAVKSGRLLIFDMKYRPLTDRVNQKSLDTF